MHMHEFLKALPKVSLHVHLMGSVQAQTAVDLCTKHDVPLPDYEEPEDLYDYPDIYKFLHLYDNTALAVQDREDFRRIAYETLTEAAENNVRYREMFFNPTTHMAAGASYETCVDGLIDGIRDARTDHGIDCKLIAAVNRMETAGAGRHHGRDAGRASARGRDRHRHGLRRGRLPARALLEGVPHGRRTRACASPHTRARTPRPGTSRPASTCWAVSGSITATT